jgi:hypothetical protein
MQQKLKPCSARFRDQMAYDSKPGVEITNIFPLSLVLLFFLLPPPCCAHLFLIASRDPRVARAEPDPSRLRQMRLFTSTLVLCSLIHSDASPLKSCTTLTAYLSTLLLLTATTVLRHFHPATSPMASPYARIQALVDQAPNDALPSQAALDRAAASLPKSLPATGLGEEVVEKHLLIDLVPGFNGPKTSANYYGFVTGGVLPVAEFADHLVTAFDQNVQVHLPDQSISTVVEDRALHALVELVNLGEAWQGRTFTTGATGANILGLACGRESVIQKRLAAGEPAVGELGLLAACMMAGVGEIQVLTAMGHSSLYKAASVVGLGRAAVKDIGSGPEQPWKINIDQLERELQREGVASIVALSSGEVNTGRFSTGSSSEMQQIRELCDKYKAWLHVDGGTRILLSIGSALYVAVNASSLGWISANA